MAGKFKFPAINYENILNRFRENLKGTSNVKKDERFFKITRDKTGQGVATIRFLPGKTVDGKEQLNYEVLFRHNLKYEGKNYNVICPSTQGKPCPICEWNRLQDGEFVFNNNFYRIRKYISNILVIDDVNPENIGKVMLFEYGPQIMQILESKLYPKEIGGKKKAPLIYFDWDSGANFELVLSKEEKDKFPKWTNSEFLAPSSIMEFLNEKGIDPKTIVDSLYDLRAIIEQIEIPSYDVIKNDFLAWLDSTGLSSSTSKKITIPRAVELQEAKKTSNIKKEQFEEIAEDEDDVDELPEPNIETTAVAQTTSTPEVSEKEQTLKKAPSSVKEKFNSFKAFMIENSEK